MILQSRQDVILRRARSSPRDHTPRNRSTAIGWGQHTDYTFIPGAMIPGVVILKPDFPELKEGWPFLWYENEYVVDAGTSYILAAQAAHAETKS
ncbi:MAG: hypothetical protein WA485_17540, partial [Candidatus Sulfotelmatobacter sp.]